jgi:hypothetical protein
LHERVASRIVMGTTSEHACSFVPRFRGRHNVLISDSGTLEVLDGFGGGGLEAHGSRQYQHAREVRSGCGSESA